MVAYHILPRWEQSKKQTGLICYKLIKGGENIQGELMKRAALLLVLAFIGLSSVSSANSIYVFAPTPNQLWELPHQYYYTWGINFSLAPDEIIAGAKLTYKNIWDWTREYNDHLYTTLLDNPKTGVVSYYDNQGGGNNFAGQGVLVGDWSDLYGGYPRNFNLVYDFAELGLLDALTECINTAPAAGRANFGFGIDPDCHYYNDSVKFTITTMTNSIPEPATIVLLGISGIASLRRRK